MFSPIFKQPFCNVCLALICTVLEGNVEQEAIKSFWKRVWFFWLRTRLKKCHVNACVRWVRYSFHKCRGYLGSVFFQSYLALGRGSSHKVMHMLVPRYLFHGQLLQRALEIFHLLVGHGRNWAKSFWKSPRCNNLSPVFHGKDKSSQMFQVRHFLPFFSMCGLQLRQSPTDRSHDRWETNKYIVNLMALWREMIVATSWPKVDLAHLSSSRTWPQSWRGWAPPPPSSDPRCPPSEEPELKRPPCVGLNKTLKKMEMEWRRPPGTSG